MNTTNVKFFDKPEAIVSISNLSVNISECKFSLNLAYTLKGKRKAIIQDVSGNITPELKEWLSVAHVDKVKSLDEQGNEIWLPTETSSTGFQRFLAKNNKQFVPGILKTLVFTSDNNSEDYHQNPFKLVLLKDKAILSLVNVASKKREEFIDPETGEKTVTYKQKYFKNNEDQYRKSFVSKKYFLRLIIQKDKLVTVAPDATSEPQPQHA